MVTRLFFVSLLALAIQPKGVAQDCVNFWIPPGASQLECLDLGIKTPSRSRSRAPVESTGPALQFSNVEAGRRFIQGEIYNTSTNPLDFKPSVVRYRLERRGEVLTRGYLIGKDESLGPGEATTFKVEMTNRLRDTPRGTGVRLILEADGNTIELKPRYNPTLN